MVRTHRLFDEDNIMFTDDFHAYNCYTQFSKDMPKIARFCHKRKVCLRQVDVTFENNHPEIMYYFSDNLGGYTINALRADAQ